MPYGPRYQIPYVLLLIVVCGSLTFANAQNAVVSGAVTAITEVSTPLVGAEINFNDDRDEPILTKTDDNGKYRVSLNPNRNYTVEVRTRGFCSVHRPTFRPISGQSLTFDLSLAVCTSSDPVEVDVSGDREMYQEETLGGNGGRRRLSSGLGGDTWREA